MHNLVFLATKTKKIYKSVYYKIERSLIVSRGYVCWLEAPTDQELLESALAVSLPVLLGGFIFNFLKEKLPEDAQYS